MVFLGSALAQAQTEKGRWTVGAQVGDLSYSDTGEPFNIRNFSISMSPSAGYFVAKNLVIGASVPVSFLAYRSSAPPNSGQFKANYTSVGLAPFIRYYVGSARLRPFASASYGYTQNWIRQTDANTGREQKSNGNFSSYAVGVGVAYFINNTVSLDASLNYTNSFRAGQSLFSTGQSANNNGSLGLNIGFRLFFGK